MKKIGEEVDIDRIGKHGLAYSVVGGCLLETI